MGVPYRPACLGELVNVEVDGQVGLDFGCTCRLAGHGRSIRQGFGHRDSVEEEEQALEITEQSLVGVSSCHLLCIYQGCFQLRDCA